MEVTNTTINMGTGYGSTNIDTSSSISSMSNTSSGSTTTNNQVSTSAYQTNNTGNTYEVEELDLSLDDESEVGTSASVEQPKKNLLSRIGDWFVDAGKAIYDTGAKVVNDVKTWCSDNLLGMGSTLAETASNIAQNALTIGAKLGSLAIDAVEAINSTGTVLLTTITSGATKVGEYVVDGLAWCGGKIVEGGSWLVGQVAGLFGADEAKENIIDWGKQADKDVKGFIARDWVGEFNTWFYETTPVGQYINEHSLMKYDSEVAKKIMNISEKATEIVAATALTIFTGGAATFALGALVGIGKSAEQTYQNNGTDTTLLQELGIAGSGALTGLSWMATGKLGEGLINVGKDVAAVGAKQVLSKMSKDILCKDFLKSTLKNGLWSKNAIGNYVSSAMMTGQELIPYINGTKEWTVKSVLDLASTFAVALGLNVVEDTFRDYVTGYKVDQAAKILGEVEGSKAVDDIPPKEPGIEIEQKVADDVTDALSSKKIVEMTSEEISASIQKEIGALDPTDPRYTDKLVLLQEKELLEQELAKRLSGVVLESSPTKSIDLLSPAEQIQVREAAQKVYDRAAAQEKEVTDLLKSLEDNEAKLTGLEFSQKSVDSIEEKIARTTLKGGNVEYNASEVNDSLRYTFIVGEGDYENTVVKKIAQLEQEGYSIKYMNNSWGANGSPTYQGLNVTMTTPAGTMMEVQFHTQNSFKVKQTLNHELYEISRNATTPPDVKNISDRIQSLNQQIYVDSTGFKYDSIYSLENAVSNVKVPIIQMAPQGKKYTGPSGYEDFQAENAESIKMWDKKAPKGSELQQALHEYKIEDSFAPGNYKVVNGYLRGTYIDDANRTITIIGTGGYPWVYSFEEYEQILGKDMETFKKEIEHSIEVLSDGISACKLADDTELVRGINWDTLKYKFGIEEGESLESIRSKMAASGGIWKEEGFLSACPSLDEGELPGICSGKPIRMVMQCEKGMGAKIFPNDYEAEVLINCGQEFAIQDVQESNGTIFIYMSHLIK